MGLLRGVLMKNKGKNFSTVSIIVILLTIILLVTGCEQSVSLDLSDATDVTQTVDATDSDNRYVLVNSATTTLDITGLSSNAVYLIKYNPSDFSIDSEDSGYVTETSSESTTDFVTGILDTPNGQIVRKDNAKVREFNANPPPVGAKKTRSHKDSFSSSKSVITTSSDSTLSVSSSSTSDTSSSDDDADLTSDSLTTDEATYTFYDANYNTVSATLRAQGTHCYVWVADDNYTETADTDSDDLITSDQAAAIATKFEDVYYPETEIFGEEYSEDDETTNLIDNSGKISIFIYDIDGDYETTKTSGSGTLGFFWSKDMYTNDYLQATYGDDYYSNETEMFYIDSYFLDAYANYMYSTLAHEFQHMLDFVHKNVENGVSPSTWYNEMLSMVCEDMMQDILDIEDSESSKSRFYYFNVGYYYGITTWRDGSDGTNSDNVYYSYANAYAFGAYLARNYGGAELIQKIALNDSVDQDSISDALEELEYTDDDGNDETCEDAFLKQGEALIYTDSTAEDFDASYPSFDKTVSYSVTADDGVTYTLNFNSVDLTDYHKGPIIFSTSKDDSPDLGTWGMSVHYVGESAAEELSGEYTIELTTRDDDEVLYLLIR
jgi:hypothetical protein